MTLPKSYVDGFLVEWAEGEYEAQVKSMRQASEAITPRFVTPGTLKSQQTKSVAARAQAVRERLARQVRKVPEVMVKITSSCRGMRQIGRHVDYISRRGEIDLEDQDGFVLKGKEQLKGLKEDWRTEGFEPIGAESDRRDTLNIVFSMPARTDEVSMKRAVRAFAATEFEGHQYVFAYHTQSTDPDPNPPEHPHVHLSVKTQSRSGKRLNPRKADLQRWREDFAAQLRAHGIEANATSRLARLKKERGSKRSIVALTERGGRVPSGDIGKTEIRVSRAQKLEEERRAYYAKLIQTLSRSEDPADRALGNALAASLKDQPHAPEPSPSRRSDRRLER